MQVKLYRHADDDDIVFVEIPTSDGNHIAEFSFSLLGESTPNTAQIVTIPDITGNTQMLKPLGEMPLRDQELHRERMLASQVEASQYEGQKQDAAEQPQDTAVSDEDTKVYPEGKEAP
jgi:hypothetical protein